MASPTAEPYGTTPLPTSQSGSPVRVTLDANNSAILDTAQQPQTQQIARLDSTLNTENLNGCIVAVSQHFCVYAVKNGLIRVLHRHSALKTLLRAHREQVVTDLQFFQDGDVLATVGTAAGKKSTVMIWRVFERSPDICAEILLEVSTNAEHMTLDRVVWHPFNPNQFWILHNATIQTENNADSKLKLATLVETTRIATYTPTAAEQGEAANVSPSHDTSSKHAVCQMHTDTIVMDGAVQLSVPGSDLTDLAWGHRDTRLVITTHAQGQVVLWDLKQLQANEDGTVSPVALQRVEAATNLSRVLFLPHEDVVDSKLNANGPAPWTPCFLTASDGNSTFTLWSPFSEQRPPQPLQIMELSEPADSYLIQVCSGPAPPDASPPSCFVVLADRTAGKILAFHVQAQWSGSGGDGDTPKKAVLAGCDYVVPFCTKYPTYSWSVTVQPTTDISVEDLSEQGGLIFDMKLFCCQSAQIQSLTLTSYMCLPPEHSWTDPTQAVRVERLQSVQSAHVSEIGSEDEMVDAVQYEEYQVDDEGEEEVEAPEPSALPDPTAAADANGSSLAGNPFANWLGSLAGKPAAQKAPPAPVETTPEAPPASALPPPISTGEGQSFLTPQDMMKDTGDAARATTPQEAARSLTPVMGNRSPQRTEPKPAVMTEEDASAIAALPMLNRGLTEVLDTASQDHDIAPGRPNRRATVTKTTLEPRPAEDVDIDRRQTVVSVSSTLTSDSVPVAPRRRSTLLQPVVSGQQALFEESERVMEVDIGAEVSKAMQNEMQSTLMPALKQTMQETLNKSTNPIKSSIGQLAKSGVKVDNEKLASALVKGLDQPLRAAFADSMKTVLIPTLESVTGQVLAQVSDRLDKMAPTNDSKTQQTVESMATQITTLTTLVNQLTTEVRSLKGSIESRTPASPVPSPQAVPPTPQQVDPRPEILALLKQKNFQAAFTKAVSVGSPDMTVFCCANADLNEVLGGTTPQLSQPILLCLVQQLGTALATNMTSDPKTEIAWLQEIALSLTPSDPSIQRHVAAVLSQLVTNINTRMKTGDPALQRPLQRLLQVIRGMQIS